MMRFKPTLLLWLSLTIAPGWANGSFLEELAGAQREASARSQRACRDGGLDGLKWRFATLDKENPVIDLSGWDKPFALLMPADRSNLNLQGRFSAGKPKDKKTGTKFSPESGKIFNVSKFAAKSGKLWVGTSRPLHAWISDRKTLDKLHQDYFRPDLDLYTGKWLPLMEKHGLSPDQQFHELQVLRGRPFPETPESAAKLYASKCSPLLKNEAGKLAKQARTWPDAEKVRDLYLRGCRLTELRAAVERVRQENVMLALQDLEKKFPERKLLEKHAATARGLDARKQSVLAKIDAAAPEAEPEAVALLADCRTLMLANPLLDDMEILAIRRGVGHFDLRDPSGTVGFPGRAPRRGMGTSLGAPALSTHSILTTFGRSGRTEWDCGIVKLSNLRGEVKTSQLYAAPSDDQLISNARVHWDANRVAFTMGSKDEPMSLFELQLDSGTTRQLSPATGDHYVDSCYLPDGNIIVMSTAIMTGLPCEGGSHLLSNMYLLDPGSGKMRQLGLDQENSYHASVQEDGRVLYIRYEYTDAAHYFMRIAMNMNPDGTNQREIYGSNSVWPTSMFYPRQVPGHPNLFSAVVSGHHGPSHMGRVVLFDINKGRREADGAVQFIGAKDEPVEAVMVDALYGRDWPKFMYPMPLDAEYYLTMMQPGPTDPWGLYLVDSFDNMTLIHQPDEDFIAWPQLFRKQPLPPVLPTRVDEKSDTSTVYIQDIYDGPGLEGIPRGKVKELAVYAFHYGYKSAASHRYIGIESGWDARYMLGTAPVNDDGSAVFKVPAMMPISLMPLDENGAALQKMRTWMNPQPGETLSCAGCHEPAGHAPSYRQTMALTQQPPPLDPWFGKPRPYSFVIEVQPVLDKYCTSCHDDGSPIDLRNSFSTAEMLGSKKYSDSYVTLQKYVRRNGPESDQQLMLPMEWHASSSKLIQILKKGHHGVKLDDEAWRRLTMWIDLNVPFHAAFHPGDYGDYGDQVEWRKKSLKKYAGLDWDPETEYRELVEEVANRDAIKPVKPAKPQQLKKPGLDGWPFPAQLAQRMQEDLDGPRTMLVEFGKPGREIRSYDRNRVITKSLDAPERIEFVRIPAGRYVLGSDNGYPNETPRVVDIPKPFWMSVAEITNSQLQAFDPTHDSRFADLPEKDQTSRGVPLYTETQPAVRVSHAKALAFCDWLGRESGRKIGLPSEEQWEWAARAGSGGDTWFGNRDADFGKFANLSDRSHGLSSHFTRRNPPQYFGFVEAIDDRQPVTAPVKTYQPNPWGLHDMIGNAEEWTSTNYAGRDDVYVVKGGSWFDVPKDATSACRWGYDENIRLPDLGFRVVINE